MDKKEIALLFRKENPISIETNVCRGDNDVFWNDDFFATSIKNALPIIREVYKFSELEKKAAPLLYKCIKPLWWNSAERLKKAGSNEKEIKKCLDFI